MDVTATRATGFAPVVDDGTRVLVLGSLPGVASLDAGQYYAHPRNGFWPIMAALSGTPLDSLTYAERLERLKSYGVGLWDVLASAERSGSLDAAIRSPEAADLRGLIDRLPALQAVAFNGATAAKIGRRILHERPAHIALLDLPSTSPAHTLPLAQKLDSWRTLLRFMQHIQA